MICGIFWDLYTLHIFVRVSLKS
uniref:Uncharacterized protein n=1 Tax=Arundo donax TaxID=35708 RepID=A0A0A9EN72_ARUDO